MKKFNLFALAIILFSLFSVSPVSAQGGGGDVSDDEVNAIARDLFCPVCENTPLDVCETQACKQWRELIRLKLSEGWTEEEIKQYFVDNYGARVLSEPPREGFNLLAYLVPPTLILIGLIILLRAFKEWKKVRELPDAPQKTTVNSVSADKSPPPQEDDYLARFEEELRKQD
jgi:cytochrome c-type biogenesis protein CcmH